MNTKITAAANDDKILTLKQCDAARHFGISPREAAEAREIALTTWPAERIAKATTAKSKAVAFRRLVSHEYLHPGMHRSVLIQRESLLAVGARHGISGQAVHKFCQEIVAYASKFGLRIEKTLSDVEKAARRDGAEDAVNKPRGTMAAG